MSDMTPEKAQALLDPIEIDRLAVTSRAMGTVCDAKGWQTSTARHHRKVADTLEAQAAELTRLRAKVEAMQVIGKHGSDTVAATLILEIAAALEGRDRVVLTNDETSLGPRILEFAAALSAYEGEK